jgi:multimeric flavodoxin WrbA
MLFQESRFMKKILILTSSPIAKGNTNTMADTFEKTALTAGATVTRFDLHTVKGTGCTACMACRTTKEWCVLKDGICDVLNAFRETDILVMAAPVWWLDVPVALRRFVERWHGLVDASFTPRIPAGKKAILLLSQGADAESFKDLPERYKEMLTWLGVTDVQWVRHCLAEENPIQNSDILEQVKSLAQGCL